MRIETNLEISVQKSTPMPLWKGTLAQETVHIMIASKVAWVVALMTHLTRFSDPDVQIRRSVT